MTNNRILKSAIIVAGGVGKRMGAALPKQFLTIAGAPVLAHTVKRFLQYDPTMLIIVVLPEESFELWDELCAQHFGLKTTISLTKGGATRSDSVRNGLAALSKRLAENEIARMVVAVHDGARPLIDKGSIGRAFDAAAETGGAYCCVPVKFSLRQRKENGLAVVDRNDFVEIQTPQTFRFSTIATAYRRINEGDYTDDASLVEAAGFAVAAVDGHPANLKITTPDDLAVAEQLLKGEAFEPTV